MKYNLENMLELLREVEAGDPIDFGDLPVDEDALRRLVMTYMLEQDANLEDSLPGLHQRVVIHLLTAAKLVLENMVLHIQLLKANGVSSADATAELMARLTRK